MTWTAAVAPASGAGEPSASSALAREACREGRRLWLRRTAANLERALERFRSALRYDPQSAAAYAGLADVFALTYDYPRAREAVRKALELDPLLAEAHASSGFLALHADWDWEGSEAALRRALELDPQLPQAHAWHGLAL
ncbi:MAG: hypothetical protein ACRD2T_09820 [Thermoanaerobaculia bacterium]